jgi:hypothetical protein
MSSEKLGKFIDKYQDVEMRFDSVVNFKHAGKYHSIEYGKTTMLSFIDWMTISDYKVWTISNDNGFTFVTNNLLQAFKAILHYNKTGNGDFLQIVAHQSYTAAYQDLLQCELDFTEGGGDLKDLKIEIVNSKTN